MSMAPVFESPYLYFGVKVGKSIISGVVMDSRNETSKISNIQVIQSFFSMTSSQIVGRVIFVVFALFLMNVLGKYSYGLYQYIYGYTLYFLVLSGWGLDTFALKRIAEDPRTKGSIISQISYLKMILFLLGALVNVVLFWLDRSIVPEENTAIFAILYAAILFDLVGLTFQSAFIALKRPFYFFVMNISKFLFYAVLGVLFVYFNLGLIGIALGFFLACTIRASIGVALYLSRVDGDFVRPDIRQIKSIFIDSMPYALFVLIASVYVHIDAILIGIFIDKGATGVYDASYKVIEGTLFISAAFASSLMPYFVAGDRNEERLDTIFTVISLVSFFVAFSVQIGSPYLHYIFSNEFVESDRIAYYLAVYIPFAFVNHSLVYYLLAKGDNWKMIRVLSAGCFYNVAANLYFIPRYGIDAAIVNTFLTEMTICFLLIGSLKQVGKKGLYTIWMTILAVAGMMTIQFEYFTGRSFLLRIFASSLLIVAIHGRNSARFFTWYRLRRTRKPA